jgi:sulfide dehydrogenase cytochrome subunit
MVEFTVAGGSNMQRPVVVALALFLLLVAGFGRAADTESIVSECDSCHGPHGASGNDDVPTIGGLPSVVISDALLTYKDNARPCPSSKYRYGDTSRQETDMCSVAKGLADDQIDAVAEHYAGKPFVPAKQQADAAKAEVGRKVHDAHCEKCHTAGGTSSEDEASILAGQWMGYLRQSLEEFKAGEREQPKNMKAKLDALGPDDIAALIEYYGSRQ